jgi:hypothetical protein
MLMAALGDNLDPSGESLRSAHSQFFIILELFHSMVSPIIDILLFLSSYGSLFVLRKSVESSKTHPPLLRAFGFVVGCILLLSVLDWAFNFAFISYQAITENVYLFYTLFAMLLVMVVALRAVLHPLESFEVAEVKDFLRESLLLKK